MVDALSDLRVDISIARDTIARLIEQRNQALVTREAERAVRNAFPDARGKQAEGLALVVAQQLAVEAIEGDDGSLPVSVYAKDPVTGSPRYKDALQVARHGAETVARELARDFNLQESRADRDGDAPAPNGRDDRPVMTRAQLASGQYPVGMGPRDAIAGRIRVVEDGSGAPSETATHRADGRFRAEIRMTRDDVLASRYPPGFGPRDLTSGKIEVVSG